MWNNSQKHNKRQKLCNFNCWNLLKSIPHYTQTIEKPKHEDLSVHYHVWTPIWKWQKRNFQNINRKKGLISNLPVYSIWKNNMYKLWKKSGLLSHRKQVAAKYVIAKCPFENSIKTSFKKCFSSKLFKPIYRTTLKQVN